MGISTSSFFYTVFLGVPLLVGETRMERQLETNSAIVRSRSRSKSFEELELEEVQASEPTFKIQNLNVRPQILSAARIANSTLPTLVYQTKYNRNHKRIDNGEPRR